MLSNQIIQNSIDELKNITKVELAVYDLEGMKIAATSPEIETNPHIIRIFAEPFAYNATSCRVLEKAGFQFEGLLRNNAIKNGKVLDMKMYSSIKEVE